MKYTLQDAILITLQYLKNSISKSRNHSTYSAHNKCASWLEHEISYGTNCYTSTQRGILDVYNLESFLSKLENFKQFMLFRFNHTYISIFVFRFENILTVQNHIGTFDHDLLSQKRTNDEGSKSRRHK